MALAVNSTATTSFAAGTSVTITKPTGLAVGDLMIAAVGAFSGVAITISTKSGWTLVNTRSIQNGSLSIQYKTADSSDVAASNFVFSCTSASSMCGAIMRVSGQASGNELDASDNDVNNAANSSTITFTTGLSPATNGNLLVMLLGAGDGNDGGATLSSWTTSDGSLTWTEVLDTTADSGTQDPVVGMAYAIQSTATALTSYGATISGGKDDHAGILASFQVQVDATGTPELVTDIGETFEVSGTCGVTGTPELVEDSGLVSAVSGTATTPTQWTQESNPSTIWTQDN